MDTKLNFNHNEEDLPNALGLSAEEMDDINSFVVNLVLSENKVSEIFEKIAERYDYSLIRLMYAIHIYGVLRGISKTAKGSMEFIKGLLGLISDISGSEEMPNKKDLN